MNPSFQSVDPASQTNPAVEATSITGFRCERPGLRRRILGFSGVVFIGLAVTAANSRAADMLFGNFVPNLAAASLEQFWDGKGPKKNGVVDGGAGAWSNRDTSFTGRDGKKNDKWRGGIAVFDRPKGGGKAGTVSISEAVSFEDIKFTTTNYILKLDKKKAAASLTAAGRVLSTGLTATILTEPGVTATIQAPIGGMAAIKKVGMGTLILSGANTYSGGTLLDAGTVGIGNNSAFGSSTVTVGTGGISIFASKTVKNMLNGYTLNGGLTIMDVGAKGNNLTLTGPITGTGGITMNGAKSLVLGGASTYTGKTTVNSGKLVAGASSSGVPGAGGPGPFGSNPTVILNGKGSLELAGFNVGLGSLSGSAKTAVRNSSKTTPVTLTEGGNGASTTFSGVIADGNKTAKAALSLSKVGGGTLTLTGGNTYTGGTTISGGALEVDNTKGSGTGTGTVSIQSNGALQGSGKISGPVTLHGGGLLAPGTPKAASTLQAESLKFDGGGEIDFRLGKASDQLALKGALQKGTPGDYALNILNSKSLGDQNFYTLAIFGSTTFAPQDFSLSLPEGYVGTLIETPTSLNLALSFAATGPIIQNSGTGGTPKIADFTVKGPVTTGTPTENNTVNSLIFTPGSSLQISKTLTLTSGKVSDGGGSSTISGGTLAGPSGLLFTVNGSMDVASDLRGDLAKTGSGSLFIDGTLVGSAQVASGVLGGHGTISGNVVNGATVSPGNSPGTLTVRGNFTQVSSGTLVVEVAGTAPTQHDLLQVGGTASLNGTLRIVQAGSGPRLKLGDQIAFLTAGKGVSGQFSTVVNSLSNTTIIDETVSYQGNSVVLKGTQGSFDKFAENSGLTPNEQSVGAALDRAASDHRAASLISYLDGRDLTKLPGDLGSISPDSLTSVYQVGVSLANVQSINLQRRADDIRSGSSGFSAAALAMNGAGPGYSGGMGFAGPAGPDGKESRSVLAPAPDNRWGAFLSGTGEWVSVGDTNNARGYDLQTGGFTLGLDYKVTPNLALGLSAGYAGTGVDLTDGGRVLVNGGKLGVYGAFFTHCFYTDVAVNGGYNSYDTHRSALNGNARGSADGGELNVVFSTGYDIKVGALTFGPTGTFNYTNVRLNSFTETGSLAPLDIHGGNGDSLRTAFGFKASYDLKVGGVVVKPEVRAAWQHENGDTTYALDSDFANGAGSVFTVNGPEIGRDSALISAGFAIQWNERMATYVYYDGELGRTNYSSQNVTGGVRVAF